MNIKIVALTASAFLLASCDAIDRKEFTVETAEREIMNSCVENDDNTEAQCVCVLGGLKSELPAEDYDMMMKVITMAMNTDLTGMWDFFINNDLDSEELERFGENLEIVTERLEELCDNPDLDLRISV
ncbi:MAG: hypothetical protein COB37_06900 [Kordiimonadales bacterium]|nr:MAG: hypothetical protein COB37_06900 [Kordiimonadales bacterium]